MWEVAGLALTAGGLVEVKADLGWAAGLSAGILVGTVVAMVVWARAHRTMWLSKTREGDCPKFKIDFVPGDAKVICGTPSKLLVIRQPC